MSGNNGGNGGNSRDSYTITTPIPIPASTASSLRSPGGDMMFRLSISPQATQPHTYNSQQGNPSQPSNPQPQLSNPRQRAWYPSSQDPTAYHPDFPFKDSPLPPAAGKQFYGHVGQGSYPAAQQTPVRLPCRRFGCAYSQSDFGTPQARAIHEAGHSPGSF
ncbi:hypothetical protein FIBSPDRAFT_370510 [Athelia psychrophila]|uniref:Uncharacterized protein n=1 Tax=Athelia psychrophila TaxID=1759441 RepID=A0A167VGI9_9AGAM|nr:hypothetical protein FIBSPDRAFT_370510 [Fibularhizoctonia sp. CBS 109695]